MRLPAALALAATLLLAGCTPTVALQPAENASAVACADVIVRLPDTVDGLASRETDAQGTAAWGEPAAVLLRCGVPSPAPTSELLCTTQGGVDWLVDDKDDPVLIATTYGREPAIEVIIDNRADGVVLTDLANAVEYLPKVSECTTPDVSG